MLLTWVELWGFEPQTSCYAMLTTIPAQDSASSRPRTDDQGIRVMPAGGGLTNAGQGSCRGPADNDRIRSQIQRHASAGSSTRRRTALAEARIVI